MTHGELQRLGVLINEIAMDLEELIDTQDLDPYTLDQVARATRQLTTIARRML